MHLSIFYMSLVTYYFLLILGMFRFLSRNLSIRFDLNFIPIFYDYYDYYYDYYDYYDSFIYLQPIVSLLDIHQTIYSIPCCLSFISIGK